MLPRVDAMTQLNLFEYFRASSSLPQVSLPSLNGPLSPSTAISVANKEVKEVMASEYFISYWRPSILIDVVSPHARMKL